MILRCTLRRTKDRFKVCDGIIGAVPDGAVVVRKIKRFEDASEGTYGMDCRRCESIFEVAPPMENAA